MGTKGSKPRSERTMSLPNEPIKLRYRPKHRHNVAQRYSTGAIITKEEIPTAPQEPEQSTMYPPPDMTKNDSRGNALSNYRAAARKVVDLWPDYEFFVKADMVDVETHIVEKITQVLEHLLEQRDVMKTLSSDNHRISNLLKHEEQRHSAPPGGQYGAELKVNQRTPLANGRRPSPDIRRASNSPKQKRPLTRSSSADIVPVGVDPKKQLMAEIQKLRDTAKSSTLTRGTKASGEWSPSPKVKACRSKTTDSTASTLSNSSAYNADDDHIAPSEIMDWIQGEHIRLEQTVTSELKSELDNIHRFVDNKTKFSFLSSILMECYKVCTIVKEEFSEKLERLLLHPLCDGPEDGQTSSSTEELSGIRKGSVVENIMRYEENTDENLQKRFNLSYSIPVKMHRDALLFLGKTAQQVNPRRISEDVIKLLSHTQPRMMTIVLASNSVFRKFLDDCSRVCWQMCLSEPPIIPSMESKEFHDDIHMSFRSQNIDGFNIDYYIWPVLLYKSNDNENVARKGRVVTG